MTAIRQAFANFIADCMTPTALAVVVRDSLNKQPKPSRDSQRGWSTNITFRTYNALKNQGVLV